MIKVRVKVSGEAGSFAVVVCAGSLRQAEQIMKARYPDSAVGIAFPIEPDHFFIEGPTTAGAPVLPTRRGRVNRGRLS